MNTTANIFQPKPQQWGLRGDPELWKMLNEQFNSEDPPRTQEGFEDWLQKTFQALLSQGERQSAEIIYFPNFSQDGMSGGKIHVPWWQEKGLPILKSRFEAYLHSSANI